MLFRRGNPLGLIRDPVYGYVDFDKVVEKPVIDSEAVQRLRWLRQLQLAFTVYPGADHSRFQHSVGVMNLAGLFAEQLLREIEEEGLGGYSVEQVYYSARIAGLLHDAGHGPFSHAFEEAIYWAKKLPIANHEEAGYHIVRHTGIADHLEAEGLSDLVLDILGPEPRGGAVHRLIRKTVKEWVYPADILDFLLRDSYYAGTREYGAVDYTRLIKLSHVDPEDPSNICLEERALSALAEYLHARISMFENVYIHPVSAVFSHTASLMMRLTDEKTQYYTEAIERLSQGDPSLYLRLTDYGAIELAMRLAGEGDERLAALVNSILYRRPLWKMVYEQKVSIEPSQLRGITGALLLNLSKEIKRRIDERVREELGEDYWISMSTLKPTPPVPTGYIQLCRVKTGSPENTRRLTIPDLLESEGIRLKILIRAYVPAHVYGDEEKRRYAEKKYMEILEEYITPRSLLSGITM